MKMEYKAVSCAFVELRTKNVFPEYWWGRATAWMETTLVGVGEEFSL